LNPSKRHLASWRCRSSFVSSVRTFLGISVNGESSRVPSGSREATQFLERFWRRFL
jgi:hypothetical protein